MTLPNVVATTWALPDRGIAEGQVGTIIEELDGNTVLVEFADQYGVAKVIAPVPFAALRELCVPASEVR